MKLVVISHTDHYQQDGEIVGFEPTIRELNFLAGYFEKIIHIAPLFKNEPVPQNVNGYTSNIVFIPLQPSGGQHFLDKLGILRAAWYNLPIIHSAVQEGDWIQLRLPTNLGVYLLPYFTLFPPKNLWVKYAGNWVQSSPPLSYRFQRWWLTHNFQNSAVTINGKWPDTPKHIKSFENPCMSERERLIALEIAKKKNFQGKLTMLFVGRIEKEKGFDRLVNALNLYAEFSDYVEELVVIGEGKDMAYLNVLSESSRIPVRITGALCRSALNQEYSNGHFLILPTLSEGFPKVLSEAASFGCIPIVSDVSSISQYIETRKNGWLLPDLSIEKIAEIIWQALKSDSILKEVSSCTIELAKQFTYEYYWKKLTKEIIQPTN